MNRISEEKSAYLKHSAYQKIDWYPWSDEAFERARKEDKPIFLSSGAIWCHWCHVMAKECFENEETVKLLNENFINIKIDRDERPDIDRRFQQAVAAMGSGGGWPLSVFLTPDGKPFFGGTYFPPEDSNGRPGFKKVLRSIADFYYSKREEVTDYAERLINFLKPKTVVPGNINESLIKEAVTNILSEFDPQNGGFGTAPKFPMPGAVAFLINRYFFTKNKSIGYAIRKTLESMAKGGFHDQIGGGFHRYSTDAEWIIPHFEKMADDNAWLLRNYIDGYSVFEDDYFRKISEGIIDFVSRELSDPEGGFYASQDADITPDDEGGYFTWTDEDFRAVLNDEEYTILSLHLLNEKGCMHHDRSKKVLFISMESEEIARKTGFDIKTVTEIINLGKEKLLRERRKRHSPFIDRTMYTSLNGMFISAYLEAFRVLKDEQLKNFALKSLERIMKVNFIHNELYHSDGVKTLLDDYIYLIDALIVAYEITGKTGYLHRADELMETCIKNFWDNVEGGFFDTEDGFFGIRLKRVEDIPHPSANSLAILLLLKLFFMTSKELYRQSAETSLRVFSSRTKGMDIHTGFYFCAMDAYFNMLKLTLETSPHSQLTQTVISSFHPYMSIVYGEDNGRVIPCLRDRCYEPIESIDELRTFKRKINSKDK